MKSEIQEHEDHDRPLTYKEIAEIMNISTAQVIDLEARAIRKLKRNPRARKLLQEYILT